MNRLQLSKAPKTKYSLPAAQDNLSLSSLTLDDATNCDPASRSLHRRDELAYSLFAPLHYERGYAYPLIIWLHGEGGNELELRRIMPYVSVRNYVAAAARGGVRSEVKHGYQWVQSGIEGSDAADRIEECIAAACRRFNVNRKRIFIAGYGQGGTMALRLALQFPERFAGAISLGGAMPLGNCPLKRVNSARQLPILLSTCQFSADYPAARVAEDLRLLHSAGFSLALRQYPGREGLTTGMLADMDRWIMEHVCSVASAAPAI